MGTGGLEESAYATIVTERLKLRPRMPADELILNALAANPAIAPALCPTIDRGSALAIVAAESGRIIGGAVYGGSGLGTGVEISIWIGEPDWHHGYATEATQALIDRVFTENPATVAVWCSKRASNDRARRVIEKCGFQYRGTGMVRLPGRGAFPTERFALDRRTWASLKAWASGRREGLSHAPCETAA
ncbi:MAG TPA: GNAT family protein [Bauldia sp.]|nr:GNAT family protein [Bauldia sp.]